MNQDTEGQEQKKKEFFNLLGVQAIYGWVVCLFTLIIWKDPPANIKNKSNSESCKI